MSMLQTLNTDEYALWLSFKNGDLKAFSCIYETYIGVLYNYGYHIVQDEAVVKDAIQDLFTHLWRSKDNLSPTNSIKYYLFRALRRRIHLISKEKQLLLPLSDILSDHHHTHSAEDFLIKEEMKQEQVNALRKAITKLPDRQHEVIRLYFFDGFDFDEIADIMQINEQSVRNLIYRSILKLKQNLSLTV